MDPQDGGSTAGFSTASRERVHDAAPRADLPPLPTLTVLCHPDLDRIGERVLLTELVRGREALVSRQQPSFSPLGVTSGRPLEDRFLSRTPLRLAASPGGSIAVRRAGCRMAAAFDGDSLDERCCMTAEAIDNGVVVELAHRVVLLLHLLPRPPEPPPPRFGLVGESAAITRVRQTIERVAELEVPVLLRGETGTGKELVAQALHEHSPRQDESFVTVNLGAITSTLATAELFGASKGAYTGADRDQLGYFRRADGGTLFLDEIGEAPPELQVMLLRVLETHEVIPVGSREPQRVDVRIVSATDADLDSQVREGGFKAPLLHRLMSYTLDVPPLRRRRDDIGTLLIHFLRLERQAIREPPPPSLPNSRTPWLPASLVANLARYDWPGNVRQLRNVARQLVIDGRGQSQLDRRFRPDAALDGRAPAAPSALLEGDDTWSMDEQPPQDKRSTAPRPTPRRRRRKPSEVTENEMLDALRRHDFELKATAAALGISRTSLYDLVKRSPQVRAATDVPPEEIRAAFERCCGEVPATARELQVSERALRQRLKDLGIR